jgi:hypothetical protein
MKLMQTGFSTLLNADDAEFLLAAGEGDEQDNPIDIETAFDLFHID